MCHLSNIDKGFRLSKEESRQSTTETQKNPQKSDRFSTSIGYIIARVYRGRVTGIGVPFSRYKLFRVHVGTYARANTERGGTHARTCSTRTRLTSSVEVEQGMIYFPFSKKETKKASYERATLERLFVRVCSRKRLLKARSAGKRAQVERIKRRKSKNSRVKKNN